MSIHKVLLSIHVRIRLIQSHCSAAVWVINWLRKERSFHWISVVSATFCRGCRASLRNRILNGNKYRESFSFSITFYFFLGWLRMEKDKRRNRRFCFGSLTITNSILYFVMLCLTDLRTFVVCPIMSEHEFQ